ncbi:MAG TPA: UbiA family prenyltransferase [Terracidiphilus sp.]|nr:UbiA family prenyltransferase [Terracidiphilus sp.]
MSVDPQAGQSASLAAPPIPWRRRLTAHLHIARFDHSIKQIFILPGIVLALALGGNPLNLALAGRIVLGLIAATLIASSNYVINEILDAPFDRLHPTKKIRPAANGLVHLGWGYAQWILMMLVGLALASLITRGFFFSALGLWIMGCVYNIAPIRSKDLPYIDVLSESVNNPLRFCLGWYIVTANMLPPVSLLLSYWLLGAYFMGLKRFSEYRQIADHDLAVSYRKSFRHYTEQSLLNSVLFYAAASMLFFGAFLMRYRMELIFAFPFVAWLMAIYFGLAFRHESAVQNPEKLYREPRLMLALVLCIVVFIVLLFVDMPWIAGLFPKSHP